MGAQQTKEKNCKQTYTRWAYTPFSSQCSQKKGGKSVTGQSSVLIGLSLPQQTQMPPVSPQGDTGAQQMKEKNCQHTYTRWACTSFNSQCLPDHKAA